MTLQFDDSTCCIWKSRRIIILCWKLTCRASSRDKISSVGQRSQHVHILPNSDRLHWTLSKYCYKGLGWLNRWYLPQETDIRVQQGNFSLEIGRSNKQIWIDASLLITGDLLDVSIYLPNLSTSSTGYDTWSIFKQSITGLNSVFLWPVTILWLKSPVCPIT